MFSASLCIFECWAVRTPSSSLTPLNLPLHFQLPPTNLGGPIANKQNIAPKHGETSINFLGWDKRRVFYIIRLPSGLDIKHLLCEHQLFALELLINQHFLVVSMINIDHLDIIVLFPRWLVDIFQVLLCFFLKKTRFRFETNGEKSRHGLRFMPKAGEPLLRKPVPA